MSVIAVGDKYVIRRVYAQHSYLSVLRGDFATPMRDSCLSNPDLQHIQLSSYIQVTQGRTDNQILKHYISLKILQASLRKFETRCLVSFIEWL